MPSTAKHRVTRERAPNRVTGRPRKRLARSRRRVERFGLQLTAGTDETRGDKREHEASDPSHARALRRRNAQSNATPKASHGCAEKRAPCALRQAQPSAISFLLASIVSGGSPSAAPACPGGPERSEREAYSVGITS